MRRGINNFFAYFSFSTAIFLGSFLLFQIEPIISKYILPYFGGASSVWITAMLFFQLFLLFGYFYVFLISRLSFKIQIPLHAILVLSVTSFLLYPFLNSQIPLLPDLEYNSPKSFPFFQVLYILFTAIGLPYFLLSTTSILLQKWFGIIHKDKSPYIFYSLSNTAALIALTTYPFLIEPYFPLRNQTTAWIVGFISFSAFLLICCLQSFLSSPKVAAQKIVEKNIKRISKLHLLLWILLPLISTLMLLSITNLLTQSVASFPFLWLLPLSLYLISFIIVFSGKWYFRNFYAYLFLFSGFWALIFTLTNVFSFYFGILIYSLACFSSCMLCHWELYKLKPKVEYLDIYYLCTSLGGAISGIFAGLIAPIFFKGIWEVYLAFYSVFILVIVIFLINKNLFFLRILSFIIPTKSKKDILIAAILFFPFVLAGVSLFGGIYYQYKTIDTQRSFYGLVTVRQTTSKNAVNTTYLLHGNIIHGDQISGELRREPTTYYSRKSSIGIVLTKLEQMRKNLNIGFVGLGVGTLAAYGREGDLMVFYEINPQIVSIAKKHFTYLQDSKAKIEIVMGDARLMLKNEIKATSAVKYDLLVIDAFSDDAIPFHLLTKEALEIYMQRLIPQGGILAFHISNRYLDLKPPLFGLAKYYNIPYYHMPTFKKNLEIESDWVFLSSNKQLFEAPEIKKLVVSDKKSKQVNLWTDQYSNLFQVLK